MTTVVEEQVEVLLADLQLERSGLAPHDPEPTAGRASRLSEPLAALGLTAFVAELRGQAPCVPGVHSLLDLEADEAGREVSYRLRRAEARAAAPEIWAWLRRCRDSAPSGRPWWTVGSALPLPADSVRTMAAVTAPVPDLTPVTAAWAAQCGLRRHTAEYNWRWLMLGKGLPLPAGRPLPRLNQLINGLVQQAREYGLLPRAHHVQLIRRPNTPSMVMPVRLPGLSLLSVPTAVTPVTVQYLQHEIAHLTEHGVRPARAALLDRWAFDPLRSEGWALLVEHLAASPALLVRLGLSDDTAEAVARFLGQEERFSRGMMAVDLALDRDLEDCASTAEALEAAAAHAARTGLRWAPELLLLRQTSMLNWRSYLAGYAWRDTVLTELTRHFGPQWELRDDAWAALLSALAGTGSAADFLHDLHTGQADEEPGPVIHDERSKETP
ncbi:hypothetical protein [Streptomyces sp. NPDC006552]|uniref:hypothetical protein n=1 Tax=Streptomyces sp. NPDC006552 TaxID=3157179 RepID=UPI0033A5A58C